MSFPTDINAYVLGVAAKSNVEKRQVGCIIVATSREGVEVENPAIVGEGFNTEPCQDWPMGLHAEDNALHDLNKSLSPISKSKVMLKAYVSHAPCPDCAAKLSDAGVNEVVVVEAFMKFDGDKLRYDLMPPGPIAEVVKVLTDGARKYKPNNWRECTDLGRYEAAMMRHFEAYRAGELIDPDSGSPHLAHAMCNLVFLMELTPENKVHQV